MKGAFAVLAFATLVVTACADHSVEAPPTPQPRLVPTSGGLSCTEPDARLSSGALYKVCVDPAKWNRDIVVFIPGYHDPVSAPELPDDFSGTSVSVLFSQLGYAFASTSFRGTGLIQRSWIDEDLLELVRIAKELLTSTTGRTARFVYQTGGSQGGLGTVQALERFPGVFSGGLAGCGPIGDYRKQIDYVGDVRAVFDYSFADVIPDWPVWRQNLTESNPGYADPDTWRAAEPAAAAAISDPRNADRIAQVLAVTHAPIDAGTPSSVAGTTLGVLWYSFRGTNDGIAKLGGMPFDNLSRTYTGSANDAALNAGVARFEETTDPAKLAAVQTSAHLRRPLVTIHNTGDPIVPIWHEPLYRRRLDFVGRLFHTPITIDRYGHCNFTDAEILGAFAVLVLKVSGYNLVASTRVLPSHEAQAQFLRVAQSQGAHPEVVP